MKNNPLLFVMACASLAVCSMSAHAQSAPESPMSSAGSEAITITPDNSSTFFWDNSLQAYRIRYNDGASPAFHISVLPGYGNAQIRLLPWSFNTSWSPFDANWMFNTMSGMQGFNDYNTDNPVVSGQASSQTTTLPYANTTIRFTVPIYNPGYRTSSITVTVGNHQKTIRIIQSTY